MQYSFVAQYEFQDHTLSHPETTLDELLSASGGASLEANIRSVEITQPRADKSSRRTQVDLASTSPSLISLNPGDTIRVGQNFKRIEDRHVLLSGEVKNPGTLMI